MKKEIFIWTGLFSGIFVLFWEVVDFRNTQEAYFNEMKASWKTLQRDVKTLENDVAFIKDHQKDIDYLLGKGWFIPKSRLLAAEVLEKIGASLNEIRFTFEPEQIKKLEEEKLFKITKIVLMVGATLDSDIYAFLDMLLKKFPGILRTHEFSVVRTENVNEKTLLFSKQNKCLNFVEGKLVLEWVALGEENHEK